jgi:hypothetical protein
VIYRDTGIDYNKFHDSSAKSDIHTGQYAGGKKELCEINMEFNARYIKDDDMPGRRGCSFAG